MTDLYSHVFGDHWAMATLTILCATAVASLTVSLAIVFVIRFFRFLILAFRGWPPLHLDADGDWPPHLKDLKEAMKEARRVERQKKGGSVVPFPRD